MQLPSSCVHITSAGLQSSFQMTFACLQVELNLVRGQTYACEQVYERADTELFGLSASWTEKHLRLNHKLCQSVRVGLHFNELFASYQFINEN